jgi:hypothetical protein
MELLVPATDRPRSSLSEILLYAEHPFHPIHAALFTNYDGTMTLVVCARTPEEIGSSFWVSLARDGQPFARTACITLRPGRGNAPTDRITFDDLGEHFTGIHFESARPTARGLVN